MLTTMGIYAQRTNIEIGSARVRVLKEMSSSGPRRIARLSVAFTIPTPLSAEQQEKLRNVAMTCPVHKSLHPDVAIPVTFNFGTGL